MFKKILNAFGNNASQKEIEKLGQIAARINALEPEFEALSDDALRAKTDEFRAFLRQAVAGIEDEDARFQAEQEALEEILPQAFATVREASKRTLGLRHYDVQLIGGVALHRGTIVEMKTGEGKTLVATLPVYLNALTGHGVHLITVNDYLARRDARWMGPIYHMLGLSIGVLQMAASTENGKKAYLYDPAYEASQEDQHNLRLVPRREAYQADITYGTNSEFGFDYLRDNMAMKLQDRVQRGHYYAIIDEVDNVLIDEARTPLIISGPAQGNLEWYSRMADLVRRLKPEDYEINEKDRTIALTELGIAHVEELLGQPLSDPERPEDVTPEQARLMGYLEQALRAQFLFKRNKDYLVQGGKVIIVDEFTGRMMPGRRWSDGLHQAVEAKEGVRIQPENITYATVTIQNYFRMYKKLAGMTGTAVTEAEEFDEIYSLNVLAVPMNLEYRASRPDSDLQTVKARDEEGYQYTYYARKDDPQKIPVFWKRKDYPDAVYRTREAKMRALGREALREHVRGRPLLIGTTSVENSEYLSRRLQADMIRRLAVTLILRDAWFEVNQTEDDGRLIPELQVLYTPLDVMQTSELRLFARQVKTPLQPDAPENVARLLKILRLSPEDQPRLLEVLKKGIPHQVLNARKHTEESRIIAGAGAFGAVTIATNMAGRGVDIKLGGELAEEVLAIVSRVLKRNGYAEPYELTLDERRRILQEMSAEQFGIYEAEIQHFLRYFDDMERVRELGGLYVLGSERHESRRIDNQLRGRAARQGDPGASRFYLSLEDDLMRLFGGDQVSNVMNRLRVDESVPLENKLVSNLVEQSQQRVEGANFDMRKHLLEYDDVLNKQRMQIYAQRDRIFVKDDLTEDVNALLEDEIAERVPKAYEDEEGPWRLLAWLEQSQPTFQHNGGYYPSYMYELLLELLDDVETAADLRAAALDLVEKAVAAQHEHLWRSLARIMERTRDNVEMQIEERLDTLHTALEGLEDNEEGPRRPRAMLEELSALTGVALRLSSEDLRLLAEDPLAVEDELADQIDVAQTELALKRLVMTLEYRLGRRLDVDREDLAQYEWDDILLILEEKAKVVLAAAQEALLGEKGEVRRDLDVLIEQLPPQIDDNAKLRLLANLTQGTRIAFNAKHQKTTQAYQRFSYLYYAGGLLANQRPEDAQEDILLHLQDAQAAQRENLGRQVFRDRAQNARAVVQIDPGLAQVLPPEKLSLAPDALTEDEQAQAVAWLGQRIQAEIYRQILLTAITNAWVEYLTQIEALRVSIGLEAYAQRNPLVEYKRKASEMFAGLIYEIRADVISRIFQPVTPRTTVTPVRTPKKKKSGKKKRRKS